MEWGGAEIGWAANSSEYVRHHLSGDNSAQIVCKYKDTYSAISFRLDPSCDDEFACYNGGCVFEIYVCDGFNHCGDNSDEQNCYLNYWVSVTSVSYSTLARSDNNYSSVSTSGTFQFGSGSVSTVYISSNGYVSMGTPPTANSPEIPDTDNIVSPYGADIDPSLTGTVRYTDFITYHPQMNSVSNFIWSQTKKSFYGTRMMVAEWDSVPKYDGSSVRLHAHGNTMCLEH
jgi:hypothetical protein